MSDNVCWPHNLAIGLVKALHLPEHTTEFSLCVKAGEPITVKGTHWITDTQLAEFERVFKDKSELVEKETQNEQ